MMSLPIDRRYELVRKKLEQLDHKQAFGIDSLLLVETLVEELFEARQSIGDLRYRIDESENANVESQTHCMGLKREHNRQTKEILELRSELLKKTDKLEEVELVYQQKIKRLERALDELRVSQTQWSSAIEARGKNESKVRNLLEDMANSSTVYIFSIGDELCNSLDRVSGEPIIRGFCSVRPGQKGDFGIAGKGEGWVALNVTRMVVL